MADIEHPRNGWRYDADAAMKPVEFIETFCKIPSGRLGAPFVLELYEKAWLNAIFGFVNDEGLRRFHEVMVDVGRKNGKTAFAAAVEIYLLVADGEGAPQVYNAATTLDQAKLGFKHVLSMVRQSTELSKHVRKQTDRLFCSLNMGYIAPLASNVSSLDGLDVHGAVIDEIHAMKNRDIYDLLRQGTGARQQPLIITITTNGFVRNSIFDEQYAYASKWLKGEIDDDSFLAFIYELDEREEWLEEKAWIKANPGLGTVKNVSYLREQVNKAQQDASYRPTVMTKDFNMPENASIAWLAFEDAVNTTMYFGTKDTPAYRELGFRYGICGFDASDSVDLTAAQMLVMRPGDDRIYERSMYWIPESVIEEMDEGVSRRERDVAPYRQWISRGLMRTVPGNKVDKRVLLDWLEELRDEEDLYTYAIGFDPWHMVEDYLVQSIENFVGSSRVYKVRQGAKTLSQPMKMLKAEYKANRIVDNHNPINEWCRMNVMVKVDNNDNYLPVKKGLDPRNRIDGFMAELDAYVTLLSVRDDYLQIC